MKEAEKLTASEETFCQEYVLNNGNATAAWQVAYPGSKAKIETKYSKASIMLSQEKIKARISELQEQARVKATEAFTITVEQRLRWLKEITEAGLGEYIDQNGNKRRENLAAARAAVATMNDMIGVADSDADQKATPLAITFTVSAAKGKIETTNIERD